MNLYFGDDFIVPLTANGNVCVCLWAELDVNVGSAENVGRYNVATMGRGRDHVTTVWDDVDDSVA